MDRWRPSLLVCLIPIGLVCGMAVLGCKEHSPEEVAERSRVEAERWRGEVAKQLKRELLIQQAIKRGVFTKLDLRQRNATAWVGPTFYALEFDDRESFCSVIYAYIATKVQDDAVWVTLKDAFSGKTVGSYEYRWGGPKLKMK